MDADDAASIGILQQLVKERSLKDGPSFIRALGVKTDVASGECGNIRG